MPIDVHRCDGLRVIWSRHQNLSDLHPKRLHADTHGQSAAVFGLAYLLGIELMPRIRRWRKLKLYRPNRDGRYWSINTLFGGTVNWALIREHYPQLMQLALAIQSGRLAPSAVLARVNSYSSRDRFALALQELGKAVRTRFLLQWIEDDPLRRVVHKGTTKIERHHRFAKHFDFGGGGLLRTNDPADQEKAIVYNELVANAVALQKRNSGNNIRCCPPYCSACGSHSEPLRRPRRTPQSVAASNARNAA